MMQGSFENSGKMIRLILRRERLISTVWLTSLILFSVGLAPGLAAMFDEPARQALALTLQNPGMIALMGPVYGAENYTPGAMYANTMLLWVMLAVAVMNIFLVLRHTRGDEEKGRTEVIRSLPTGRLAILHATMLSALLVNAVLALLTGFGIAVQGIPSMDFAGSMFYGAALGVTGFVFAALTAVFSQVSSSSQGAMAYSFLALGLFYMLRAAGDVGSEGLALVSPLGLVQRSQVFVENHWWPLVIALIEGLVISVAAYALNAKRDMEQGLIPARAGRRDASSALQSPFGLAFRLLRTSLLVWLLVMFVLGASYGAILGDIEGFVAQSPFYQAVLGMTGEFSAAEMFTSMVNAIAALICVVPLLGAVLKPRNEEKEGRTEQILARPVSRRSYLSGYMTLSLASSVQFQCATALGLYASATVVLKEPIPLTFLLEANLVYLPALWVMIGLCVFLIGCLPKASAAIWAYFAFSFFTTFMGRIISLPEWLPKLSPFAYIPQLPVDRVELAPLLVLTGIAALLTMAGFISYGRRDLAS